MKIQSPWMGRVKGSAGNMTGSKVYDKNVLRAKAFEVSNPNTTAQQKVRNFFTELSQFVQNFSPEILRNLFPSKPKAKSRRNELTQQLSSAYDDDGNEKYLDYGAIVTFGNAQQKELFVPEVTFNGSSIELAWDSEPYEGTPLGINVVLFAIIDEETKTIAFPSTRIALMDGDVNIPLPNGMNENDAVHAIAFIGNATVTNTQTPVSLATTEVLYRPKE